MVLAQRRSRHPHSVAAASASIKSARANEAGCSISPILTTWAWPTGNWPRTANRCGPTRSTESAPACPPRPFRPRRRSSQIASPAEIVTDGGLTRLAGRPRQNVDHIVVDHDRTDPAGPAARRRSAVKQAVVHDHVAGDLADARRPATSRARWSSPASGFVPTISLRRLPPEYVWSSSLNNNGPLGPGSASHAQVALCDQDQVALELALGIHFAMAHQRRLKPIPRPELDERGGRAEQLGHGSRRKELVGVSLVDDLTRLAVDDQNAPMPILKARRSSGRPRRGATERP